MLTNGGVSIGAYARLNSDAWTPDMRDRSQSPLLPIVTSHPTHPEHLPWASLQGLDAFAEPAELGFCCIGLVYGVLLTSLLVLYFAALHWPCSCSLQLFFLVWVP